MHDAMPLWFWLPAAVLLWVAVIYLAIRDHRERMAADRAEAARYGVHQ